jgi:SAM-dependent methyltransferase
MTKDVLDGQYYEVAKPSSLAERILIKARDQIYSDFISEIQPVPTEAILDVGISDVLTNGANFLERLYPYQESITACGLGEAQEFQSAFPKIRYVQIEPNRRLPFADKSFDVATSNAVLEHVGSRQNQLNFIAEMARVAKKVFISVPHRYFPVEHHTGFPLLHWMDASFTLACKLTGKSKWSREDELILMTGKKLRSLIPSGVKYRTGYTGIKIGPLSSNLYLVLS